VGTGGPPASSQDLEPVASDVLSQIVVHSFLLLGCAARCQTTLEREQAVPTQESFSGTDCLFDELIATTLPNGSATSGYRFPGRTSHPFVGRSEHHNVQQSKQRKESTLTSGQQMAAQTIIIHAQG
jgi:hypothetical protein